MERQQHWEEVYRTKSADSVSWHQPTPEPSLHALDKLSVPTTASLIDVGGGASALVDHLLGRNFADLTVLDVADSALDTARRRLGASATKVHWEVADITDWSPPRRYDVWHDRAVFHFLTGDAQRRAYVDALREALAPGGALVIATFALDGPEKCSGLPVRRYDRTLLAQELGDDFTPIEDWRETHATPWGSTQAFTWCTFRKL